MTGNPFTQPFAPIATTAPGPLTNKTATTGPNQKVRDWAGFTAGQVTFINQLAVDTNLNEGVIAAWCFAEENGSAAQSRQAAGNHNWLNIGYFDSGAGQIAFNSTFKDPTTAADQTARFLKGTWGGASAGIQRILGSVGKSPGAQIAAIQTSGWASSGYPSLPSIYNGLNPTIKSATPGGVAGAGGSGTLTNSTSASGTLGLTSGFTVGDPSNPDEDYWTAMNRLAQERYWYLFSDGETLYLADGPDLMRQTPAAQLDRIQNLDRINHLDLVWDNTAWQYSATHKKRKRAQRRTSHAKIVSPVEATLDLICAIDECRAGDVVSLANTGPGDGDWLIGNCRRSVFEVMSEINMVIALTPLSENQLNPAGVNQNNLSSQLGGIGVGVGKYKNYVNPVGNWSSSRIDAGVDGTLVSQYLAPGNSLIVEAEASDPGWQGSGYVAGKLLDGPYKGLIWYVTEGIAPIVPNGAVVKAGTPVARLAISPYGNSYGKGALGAIETGWANPAAPRQPMGYGDDQGPRAIAFGTSFNRFLTKLGANPGALQGRGVHTVPAALPPGYP